MDTTGFIYVWVAISLIACALLCAFVILVRVCTEVKSRKDRSDSSTIPDVATVLTYIGAHEKMHHTKELRQLYLEGKSIPVYCGLCGRRFNADIIIGETAGYQIQCPTCGHTLTHIKDRILNCTGDNEISI
jgi:hypothetical protein